MNSRIFIHPFERYRETTLLGVGLTGLIIGSLIGYLCQMRYDGIIDAHTADSVALHQPLVDNLINVFSLFVCLYLSGLWINRRTRPIDILTSALLARFPMYILPLFNTGGTLASSTERITETVQTGIGQPTWQDTALILIVGIVGILAITYSIVLLYQGFRVATHAKKRIHQVSFALSVIAAIIFSKLTIILLAY